MTIKQECYHISRFPKLLVAFFLIYIQQTLIHPNQTKKKILIYIKNTSLPFIEYSF